MKIFCKNYLSLQVEFMKMNFCDNSSLLKVALVTLNFVTVNFVAITSVVKSKEFTVQYFIFSQEMDTDEEFSLQERIILDLRKKLDKELAKTVSKGRAQVLFVLILFLIQQIACGLLECTYIPTTHDTHTIRIVAYTAGNQLVVCLIFPRSAFLIQFN